MESMNRKYNSFHRQAGAAIMQFVTANWYSMYCLRTKTQLKVFPKTEGTKKLKLLWKSFPLHYNLGRLVALGDLRGSIGRDHYFKKS